MQVKSTSNSENSRNTVVSIKVSAREKAELQEMAGEIELTLSEFLRLKGLSKIDKVTNFEKELQEKDEEIKKLKIALSFFNKKVNDMPVIALHLTRLQWELLMLVFDNYYGDNKPVEHQIIRYLVDDILTLHHDLEETIIYRYDGKAVRALISTRREFPFFHKSDPNTLHNAFNEYGIREYNELLQVKRSL